MFRMVFLSALIALGMSGAPGAQTAGDADEIESVIRSQIAAMEQDDWALAFSFASPTIQMMFQNPHNFSEMVKRGYPMVWRPRGVTAGAIRPVEGGLMQTMLFEDRQGRLYVADYMMQLVDGVWRINGVMIRPAQSGSA